MVYICSPRTNHGDANLKLSNPTKIHLRLSRKRKKKEKPEEDVVEVQQTESQENSEKPIDVVEVPETFKEHYTLLPPFSHAAIVEDEKNELKYSILEPTLTDLDKSWVKEIKSILWDELTISTKGFENRKEAEEFLKLKILETAVKYKIDVDANTLGKYQYYITRDFLGFGKIDGIMLDENIEDVSCDGLNSPVFVWHRKYESIPSNVMYESHEELENFVFKLAYLCGRHISIAQPILDGTLTDGSRAQVTYGTEVTPKGSTYTIRKFKKSPLTIIDLIIYKGLSAEIAAYYWFLIEN